MNGQTMNQEKNDVISHGRIYVTAKGVALTLVGVSPLLIAKLQSAGTLPDVPKRKLQLDFGEGESTYQEEELTEEDLQDDEERKAWKEYAEARNAILTKRNDNFLKAVFAKGVEVDMSRIEEWKADMAYFDIVIPTHPLDQKVEFIQTEALSSTQDMVEIITGVLSESGIPEEDLAEVRGMFQRSIRRGPAGETVDAEGEMVVEQHPDGDESGALLGSVASQQLLLGE